MAIGCFVSVGRTLQDAVARVTLAEELGYEAAYVTHIAARDSLTVLAAYAAATSRIGLGTGVVPIYTRTPATMAMTAATMHEQSGGRLRLGLGVSHRPVVEGWHGQTIDKPVAEMREYVAIVRAILAGEPPPRGREVADELRAQRASAPTRSCRSTSRPCRRRCCAWPARSPTARCCGCATPSTSAPSSCPSCSAGRERAGKTMEGFDVVAAVPSAVVEDPRRRVGGDAQGPAGLLRPAVLPRDARALGLRGGHRRLRRGRRARRRRGMQAAISDRFLGALCAVGSPDDVRAGWRAMSTRASTSPCVGPIAKTDFEATLRAAAPG